ncbi:MAG: tetratricopeptide repeat protein [Myxococcaceae bacterium]|nr:tetratricopeptide repeat protein [Myxococcaceae bacterium]
MTTMSKQELKVTKSMRNGALAAALALVAVGCATQQEVVKPAETVTPQVTPANTPQGLFAAGVAAFDAGNLDGAKQAFSKLLELQPKLVSAHYNLGVIAEREGQLAQAEKHYLAAYEIDPQHRSTLLNLGKVYRLQDKFEKAIALYEQALKTPGNEGDVALLNNLTVAYRLAKKFDKAEATARSVLVKAKDNADAYKNLTLIYFDQGNYRLAEFISGNAKKLDDKDPGVYNNLGMIYLKLDERQLALGQFQKAVALNDKFAPGHVNLGAMALSYRDYVNAEKSFAKATQLDPTSYEAFLAYGYALDGQRGRDPKKGIAAGQVFEKVLTLKAETPEAICGAGWAYSAEKSGWEKAISYLEKCAALSTTTASDKQLIDAKVKGLVAMQKSGAQAPPAQAAAKEKPKAEAGGAALLDKVSDEAAKEETAPAPAPAAPEGGNAPK